MAADFDPTQTWPPPRPSPSHSDFARLESRMEGLSQRIERSHEATIERMDRLAEAMAQVAALQASLSHHEQRAEQLEQRHLDLAERVHLQDTQLLTVRTELSAAVRTGKMLWTGLVAAGAVAAWLWERLR